MEVEFGFASEKWLSSPLNSGARKVLEGGFLFIVDKGGYYKRVVKMTA